MKILLLLMSLVVALPVISATSKVSEYKGAKKAKQMVFGVGLSRTGTSSLAAALEAMGVATLHNDRAFAPHLHAEGSFNFTHHFEKFYGGANGNGAVVDIPTAAQVNHRDHPHTP